MGCVMNFVYHSWKMFGCLFAKEVIVIHICRLHARQTKFWGVFFCCFMNVPFIHVFRLPTAGKTNLGCFFLFQNGAIYTYFFRISKRCQLYTFLEFNFFQKNEKKRIGFRGQLLFLKVFCAVSRKPTYAKFLTPSFRISYTFGRELILGAFGT